MSFISEVTGVTPGLKDASIKTNLECTKEKSKSVLKSGAAATATLATGLGSFLLASKYEPVADCFSKIADKATNLVNKGYTKIYGESPNIKEAVEDLKDFKTDAPKLFKTAMAIGIGCFAIMGLIGAHQKHQIGKIEGKYQTLADIEKAKSETPQ